MNSKFIARPIRPFWPPTPSRLIKALAKHVVRFLYILCQPLIPFESAPQEPQIPLPEEAGNLTDEQLAQCQAIFDQCEARCARIEQKAQWTFTVFAFLIPALASILVFLIRDPAFRAANHPLPLILLSVSGCLLILSFLSAARAIAVHPRQFLHIHAVINTENGAFLEYKKESYAQGLLYCATMNTATNDHIAQFVKGAQFLMVSAVLVFVSGVIATGFNMTAHMAPPIEAEGFGAVSLPPDVLSGLQSDIREAASADRAAAANTENQLKLLAGRVIALEAEVRALRNLVALAGGAGPAP